MKKLIFYTVLLCHFLFYGQTYEVTTTTRGANYSAYTGQGQSTSTSTIKVQQDPNDAYKKGIEQMSNNFRIAAQNGAFKTASEKCEDVLPININLNKFKYIFINKISASKQKEEVEINETILEELSTTSWVILDIEKEVPEDLKNNPNLAIYLYIDSQNDGWPFKNVSLSLTDYKGKIIHQRAVRHDRSASFLSKLTLKTIKTYPYKFDPSLIEKELLTNDESNNISKTDALKKLKEAKEFLELNVISKEQYEELVLKLKPILLNN
jgi:hypothetical protein